jgi:hypothetical protein
MITVPQLPDNWYSSRQHYKVNSIQIDPLTGLIYELALDLPKITVSTMIGKLDIWFDNHAIDPTTQTKITRPHYSRAMVGSRLKKLVNLGLLTSFQEPVEELGREGQYRWVFMVPVSYEEMSVDDFIILIHKSLPTRLNDPDVQEIKLHITNVNSLDLQPPIDVQAYESYVYKTLETLLDEYMAYSLSQIWNRPMDEIVEELTSDVKDFLDNLKAAIKEQGALAGNGDS